MLTVKDLVVGQFIRSNKTRNVYCILGFALDNAVGVKKVKNYNEDFFGSDDLIKSSFSEQIYYLPYDKTIGDCKYSAANFYITHIKDDCFE